MALLDFEWSRRGPRDIELALPAFVDWVDGQEPGSARPGILPWLAEFYPELFQVPDFEQRQWFYRVGFALRGLIHWPAFAPEPELPKGRQHARALPAAQTGQIWTTMTATPRAASPTPNGGSRVAHGNVP